LKHEINILIFALKQGPPLVLLVLEKLSKHFARNERGKNKILIGDVYFLSIFIPGYQISTLHNHADTYFPFPDSEKVITQISSVQAVILSSQLKEMLRNVNSQDTSQGMNKPIKLVYHPREPFYVIRQVLPLIQSPSSSN
jgi:hypothetical protein